MLTPPSSREIVGGRPAGLPPHPLRGAGRGSGVDPRWGRLGFLMVTGAVFGLDRLTKLQILASVQPGEKVAVLPWLSITDVQNAGAAYGVGRAVSGLWLAASVLTGAGILLFVLRHRTSAATALALGLGMGGIIGNGYGRLVSGSVTDFLAVPAWPIVNLADLAIGTGFVILLVRWFLGSRPGEPQS